MRPTPIIAEVTFRLLPPAAEYFVTADLRIAPKG